MRFANKKALITGASRGIGAAIALKLAGEGADIILHYRKNSGAAVAVKQEVEKGGRKAWLYAADLSSADETEKLLLAVKKDHPSLDILVANAAATSFKPLAQLEQHHIDRTLNLVVKSFILLVKGLHPLMRNKNASIVTISGIDTAKVIPGHGLLACAKGALEILTKYFAAELGPFKIRVNSVNPGLVDTDSTRFYLGEAFEAAATAANALAPGKGVGLPSDVADIVAFLCSEEAGWITGQTIYADGGISAALPLK
ncbi:MAG: SDR family oxidoreductase [Deltaproteobacteria bacterium]|nr:SDR family oxidoreductase [Deltaproteobacteria bacterium]